jgi:DNA repair exonuclease SbcCD ATPase subunit
MGSYNATEVGILLVCTTNLVLALLLALSFYRSYLRSTAGAPAETQTDEQRAWITRAETLRRTQNDQNDDDSILLSDMLSELSSISIDPLEQAFGNSMLLVEGLNGLDPQQYPQWQQDHQREITSLLAQRNELEAQIGEFKTKLDRSHKLVTTLHGQNRQMTAKTGKISNLQARQQQLADDLSELRRQNEQASKELRQSKRTLQDANLQLQEQRQQHEVEHASQKLLQKHLRQETEQLLQQLENERAVLSRTLVEKDFIESAFIDTDAATDAVTVELRQLKRDHQALQHAYQQLQSAPARS